VLLKTNTHTTPKTDEYSQRAYSYSS